ncbi:hypothetical protein DCT84_001620 [Salmonella enterica subsp. enterica serovar Glostrup]|nr:hypothetical protein [Salmonella enterica]EDQ7105576.1 hypothetical protein [Salmonella enterica subsp. enterica serovar Glostrup]EDV0467303.1 hypothetical protein [Salmonella enterica subsp. enterica serovar Saintpaul]EAN8257683.1 hypothetical protein [Salmonella enterica]EAT5020117.1 hypothetical protein [Salmonella enterica]
MARSRAERRHQMCRMKRKRRHDNANGDGSPKHLGLHYKTPCSCSCWLCGHRRDWYGPGMQELRARAKNT